MPPSMGSEYSACVVLTFRCFRLVGRPAHCYLIKPPCSCFILLMNASLCFSLRSKLSTYTCLRVTTLFRGDQYMNHLTALRFCTHVRVCPSIQVGTSFVSSHGEGGASPRPVWCRLKVAPDRSILAPNGLPRLRCRPHRPHYRPSLLSLTPRI